MSVGVRIALYVVAVTAVIALLVPFVGKLVDSFPVIADGISSAVTALSPYLTFGRSALNMLVGNAALVDIMLWFVLLAPFSLHAAGFVIKIFRRMVG